jgi:hypothetical protein
MFGAASLGRQIPDRRKAMPTGKIHYKNETGTVLRKRGGEEVLPFADFWALEYEASDSGFTILEDNTPPVVRQSLNIELTGSPQRILIPGPTHSGVMEITIQAIGDETAVEVGFNRETDPTAPVDSYTRYCERVDTRIAYCLWLSGNGVARVIFKEVLN